MTQTLWAPWRMDYILDSKPDGCVFCAATSEPDLREHLVLFVSEHSFVIMNRYPYTHAHIMVVPKRHVSDLDQLTPDENRDLFDLLVTSQGVLKRAMNPQGVNIGMNIGAGAGAGIADHIHIHLVPRWEGDTNFMPILADVRIMPEHLGATYQKLIPFFEKTIK